MDTSPQQHPFIFSEERKWRLRRHASFWGIWWLFQGVLYSFVAIGSKELYLLRLLTSMSEAFFFLLPHMFLAYSLMNFVLPRYLLKGRYIATACSVIVLFVATAAISMALSVTILPYVRVAIMGTDNKLNQYQLKESGGNPVLLKVFLSLMAGLRGGITIGGMAAAIKLMKHWYVKEQWNLQLQKENAEAQLQLLKAQVHPHFLFNTLNNIYAYTQKTSATASQLVLGLSDLLRYMLYETTQPLVSLHKELKMIEDFIGLQTIRYGQELDMHTDFKVNAVNASIAPLLLIPFVENCFKHGTSNTLAHPWVSLTIHVSEDEILQMKLLNGKPEKKPASSSSGGLGILNTKKRLALLYPGAHQLQIVDERDVFIVNLTLSLNKKTLGRKIPERITEETPYA